MNLRIRGDNVTITAELEEFVQAKLSKLNRYLPNINEIYVELSIQNSSRGPDIAVAQITVRHSRGAILRTEEKADYVDKKTIQHVLNSANDKMVRRIRRFKEKPRSKRLRERYNPTPEELMLAEALPDEMDELADAPPADDVEFQVVRRKQVAITAMHEDEAIEQMELLGHTFFMFFNADNNAVNVVYKRGSGGYGVLEPMIE